MTSESSIGNRPAVAVKYNPGCDLLLLPVFDQYLPVVTLHFMIIDLSFYLVFPSLTYPHKPLSQWERPLITQKYL